MQTPRPDVQLLIAVGQANDEVVGFDGGTIDQMLGSRRRNLTQLRR